MPSRPDPATRDWPRAERFYALAARMMAAVLQLVMTVRILGAERLPAEGPIVLAANHVSEVDPLAIALALWRSGRRQVRFLAVSGLFSGPRGWVLRRAGMIPVERGAGPEPMVADACAALREGQSVLVYPEGTVPEPGERLPAKPGAGLLALRAQVPVIPLATRGLQPKPGRRFPRLPWRCSVGFGEAVDLSRWVGRQEDREAQAAAAEHVLERIRDLHDQLPQPG